MMRTTALLLGAITAFLLSGCATSYSHVAASVSGVNPPDKLAGKWTYSIDESIKDARRTAFKPGGHPCSVHTYSLDAGPALGSAIRRAMQEFIEDGNEQQAASLRHIAFKLDAFNPRFSCAVGLVEGHCTGTAEISLGVTVAKDGVRKNFTVTTERTADAPGGNMCSTALAAPGEASRKASKDVVERAMERILATAK